MALISCPECSREISSSAPHCLGCGYPIKQTASPHGLPVQSPKHFSESAGLGQAISRTLLWLGVGFIFSLIYVLTEIGENLPQSFNALIGFYPHGIVFGISVLVPLALRLPQGPLRAVAAVFISTAVYALMVNWAISQHREAYCLGGALQGMVGALLVVFGMSKLLQIKFNPNLFLWVMPLCAVFGAAIVSIVAKNRESTSMLIVVQIAHLCWQIVVAIALVRCVANPNDSLRADARPYEGEPGAGGNGSA